MQPLLIAILALHVTSSVFWAGSTFVLARTGGDNAGRLFRPQMGAATVAALSGGGLWALVHGAGFGRPEAVLAVGIAAALTALAIQGIGVGRALRKAAGGPTNLAPAYRISAGLLMVTVVCMAVARYV